jgi:hypothetical protein
MQGVKVIWRPVRYKPRECCSTLFTEIEQLLGPHFVKNDSSPVLRGALNPDMAVAISA